MLRKILTIVFLFSYIIKLNSQDCQAWFYNFQDSVNLNKFYFYDGSAPEGQITSWNWDFGDGFTSTLENPVHTYSLNNTYLVSLTINTQNCVDTFASYVNPGNIVTSCYADFFYFIDSLNTLKVYFYGTLESDTSQNIQWNWDFGDGTYSNVQNPIHTFPADSAYNVLLTVSSNNCNTSVNRVIPTGSNAYNQECIPMFSYSVLDPNSMAYEFYNESWSNDSIFSVSWDFGDGITSSEYQPTHIYETQGQFQVTMTLQTSNCTNSISKTIYTGSNSWYPSNCQAFLFFEQDSLNPLKIQFYDASYYSGQFNSWYWEFGDGNISYEQNPVHTYNSVGEYNIILNIFSDSCLSSIEMILNINFDSIYSPELIALFFPEFLDENSIFFHNLSIGNISDYFWNFGDGNFSTAIEPTHDFDEVGIHEIALSVRNETDSNTTLISLDFQSQELMYAQCSPGGYFLKISDNSNYNYLVFPIPAENYINIKTNNVSNKEITIYNSIGQIILQKSFSTESDIVDLSELNSGIYHISIKNQNMTVNKLIIIR